MIIIAAMDDDRVIGRADGLPWDVPEDYRQYLDEVSGQAIVFGRRSYEIFGPDVTAAHIVVVSRSMDAPAGDPRVEVARSPEEALERARAHDGEVFCGGGARLYRAMLPMADRIYLSHIHGSFGGDATFPELDPDQWVEVRREPHEAFTLLEYRRR